MRLGQARGSSPLVKAGSWLIAFAVIIHVCRFCRNVRFDLSADAVHAGSCNYLNMKDFNDLKKWLVKNGYTYERARNGHYKIRRPNGSYAAQIPCTPGEYRSFRNALSDLRRAGIDVKW